MVDNDLNKSVARDKKRKDRPKIIEKTNERMFEE